MQIYALHLYLQYCTSCIGSVKSNRLIVKAVTSVFGIIQLLICLKKGVCEMKEHIKSSEDIGPCFWECDHWIKKGIKIPCILRARASLDGARCLNWGS